MSHYLIFCVFIKVILIISLIDLIIWYSKSLFLQFCFINWILATLIHLCLFHYIISEVKIILVLIIQCFNRTRGHWRLIFSNLTWSFNPTYCSTTNAWIFHKFICFSCISNYLRSIKRSHFLIILISIWSFYRWNASWCWGIIISSASGSSTIWIFSSINIFFRIVYSWK